MKSNALQLRQERGESRSRTAHNAWISEKVVQKIERGEIGVKLESIVRMALRWGVAVTDIYPGLGAKPAHPVEVGPPEKGIRPKSE